MILNASNIRITKEFLNSVPAFFIFMVLLIYNIIIFSGACLAQRYNPSRSYYENYNYSNRDYRDTTIAKGPFLRLGFGYGIPYGYLGINGEYMLFQYFSLTGALGYSPGGPGWIAGMRIYINEPEKRIRPRISALYGTVSVLTKKYGPEEIYETDQGYAYGLGIEWKFFNSGKHSLDFDIIMTDYNVPPGYEKKGPKIKFSIGYGRVF